MAKCYIREAGSELALELAARYQCVSSGLLPVELRGALQRRRAAGELSAAQLKAAEHRIAYDRLSWHLGRISEPVLHRAEALMAEGALRTLDGIHLATAELLRMRLGESLPFLTGDLRQAKAAAAVGLEVQFV